MEKISSDLLERSGKRLWIPELAPLTIEQKLDDLDLLNLNATPVSDPIQGRGLSSDIGLVPLR